MPLTAFGALVLVTSHNDPTVYAVLGAGVGVYLFYKGFRALQRKRLILNTPTSKIQSAAIGLVEVSGLATGPYTIHAPMTGYPCHYYRTAVWQLKSSGKSKSWQKVTDERVHVPFYLDDNTGRLLIDPTGADMEIHRDYQQEYSDSLMGPSFLPQEVAHFLATRGIGFDHPTKIEEYCIKPKNALFILGTLAVNPGLQVSQQPVATMGHVHASALHFELANVPAGAPHACSSSAPRVPHAPLTEAEKQARTAFATAMGFHVVAQPSDAHSAPASPHKPAVIDETEQHRRELFAASFFGTPLQQKPPAASPNTMTSVAEPAHNRTGTPPLDETEKHRRELFMASVFSMPAAAVVTASTTNNASPQPAPNANASAPLEDPYANPAPEEFDLHPPVVVMKGTHNPEFLISWKSEREVISELGWKSAAYIWGGPVLTLFCTWLLLARFGVL